MTDFDLITEPWIPVISGDGTRRLLGLKQTLLEAHTHTDIVDPFPIVEFGLKRLLTAIVIDILRPEYLSDLSDHLEAGKFTVQTVEKYFADWADRFCLFHPVYPFLQCADMDASKPKPLAALIPVLPSGTNAIHFHHAQETEFAACPAAAARLLTTISPFMTAGGAGLSPSVNGAPPWYIWVTRPTSTLFEQLLLNSVPLNSSHRKGSRADVPAWRKAAPIVAEERTTTGLLEALTWQPRRILLNKGSSGVCSITGQQSDALVSTMAFAAGLACRFEVPFFDPAVAYRATDGKITPFRVSETRDLWRDTGPLAFAFKEENSSKVKTERPEVVRNFSELIKQASAGRPDLKLTAYGIRTDMKMKVYEWKCETLSVPGRLADQFVVDHAPCQAAITAMQRSEAVAKTLAGAIRMAFPSDGKRNSSANETMVRTALSNYWTNVREPYEGLIRALSSEEALKDWQKTKKQQEDIFEDVLWKAAVGALNRELDGPNKLSVKLRYFVMAEQYLARVFRYVRADDNNEKGKAN